MKLNLAFSKAGHDKKRIYAVVGDDKETVFLSDGRYRKISNPKKKNIKHIQIIKKLPKEVEDLLADVEKLDDFSLRKIIRLYETLKEI